MDFDNETIHFFDQLIEIIATQTKRNQEVMPSEKRSEKRSENRSEKQGVMQEMKHRPLEMPEELQSLIQEYSKPLTRGDWRTCKRNESRAIYLLWRDKRHVVADFIGGPEFWDIVVGQTFYELLKNYPAGPPSDEGQTTIQLRRVW